MLFFEEEKFSDFTLNVKQRKKCKVYDLNKWMHTRYIMQKLNICITFPDISVLTVREFQRKLKRSEMESFKSDRKI